MNNSTKGRLGNFIGWLVAWIIFLGLAGLGTSIALTAAEVLLSWQRVQGWQPVTARLEMLELRDVPKQSDVGRVYEIAARYRYSVDGKEYVSERVGGYEGSREVDGWHQDTYERLQQQATGSGQGKGRQLTAWVDPAHPGRAVLDRTLRWVVLLLLFPLATLFLVLAVFMGNGMRTYAKLEASPPSPLIERLDGDPDLSKVHVWRTGLITSNAAGSLALAWLFPFLSGVIGWGIAISGYRHGRLSLAGAAGLLAFGALAAWLVFSAMRKTLRFLQQGQTVLRLDPFPARLGRELRGTINLPLDAAGENIEVTLTCLQKSGGDDNSMHDNALWENLTRVRPQPGVRGALLHVAIDLPRHLPPSLWRSSAEPAKVGANWYLQVESAKTGLKHSFEIPVLVDPRLAPAPESAPPAPDTGDIPQMMDRLKAIRTQRMEEEVAASAAVTSHARPDESLATPYIGRHGAEWRLDTRRQPYLRNVRVSGWAFLIFSPLCGIMPLAWYHAARWHGSPLEIALTLIGALVVLAPALLAPVFAYVGVQRISKRIRVTVLAGHIEVRRQSWLWSSTKRFDVACVARVDAKSMGSEIASRRIYRNYTIVATLQGGRRVELAWAVRDKDVAEALAGALQRACGGPRKAATAAACTPKTWQRPGGVLVCAIALAVTVPLAFDYSLRSPDWDGYANDTERLTRLAAQAADPGYFSQWLSRDDALHFPPRWLLNRWITAARNRLAAQRTAPADAQVIAIARSGDPAAIDGRIDEPVWNVATTIALQPESLGSRLRLYSDGRWLFVAAEVPGDTTEKGYDQLRVALHGNLAPGFVGEHVIVGGDGRASVLRSLREERSTGSREPPRLPRTEWLRYEKLKSASAVDSYRRYEVAIDMAEAGLAAGSPFTLWASIEGDPQTHPDGKFKARTYLGTTGDSSQPLWLKIP